MDKIFWPIRHKLAYDAREYHDSGSPEYDTLNPLAIAAVGDDNWNVPWDEKRPYFRSLDDAQYIIHPDDADLFIDLMEGATLHDPSR